MIVFFKENRKASVSDGLIYNPCPDFINRLCRKILLALLCAFAYLSGTSAQRVITGTVTDNNGETLPGVSIVLSGSTTGTITDLNGAYQISVPSENSVIEYSFVGYKQQTLTVGDRTVVDVVMTEESTELEEVVVVGYGVQKRVHMTGSVSQIGAKELMKAPMQNVSNLLTGKLSGVTSIQRSGKPGDDGTTLYVRGQNSYAGGTSPMVIVDGVPRTMDYLNPNDIESISVLKDASASIYGVQGANGVILITTKLGNEGAAKISYDGSYTFTQNTAMPKFMNASEYMYWHNKASEMDEITPLWTADIQTKVMNNDPETVWGQTDWLAKVFRTGLAQQHNISATGGSEKIKYYTSIGFMDQEGTLINTKFKRYNVRTNLDIQVAKNLKFITGLAGYRTDRNWPGTDIGDKAEFNPVSQAQSSLPVLKSEFQGYPVAWILGTNTAVNGYAALTESGYKNQSRYNLDSNFQLEYDFSDLTDILKGLKITAFASYNYGQTTDSNYDRYYELYTVNNKFDESVQGASGYTPGNSYSKSSSWSDNWMFRPQISYSRDFFNKHSLSAIFLLEKHKGYSNTMTGRRTEFYSDNPIDISLGFGYPTETNDIRIVSGSYSYSGQKSYVGRFNYAYHNKYLAEFLFRTDWSVKFAPENRKGFFPSGSIGWVVSQEDFFANALPMVDFLKVRASYGQAGRSYIPDDKDFIYNSAFSISQNSMALGGKPIAQFYSSNAYIIRNLTWSTTQSYNIGLDLNMWKGMLGMELDVFYQNTADIIESVDANYPPSMAGYFPKYGNTGKVENKGFEITLKHNNRINSDWSYHLRGNFSFARNKVLHRATTDNHPNYQPEVGAPLGIRYGFKALGLFQSWEEIEQYPVAPSGNLRPGDIKYLDYDGNGEIDRGKLSGDAPPNKDYVRIGYGALPEISFNFNIDVSYKNFYLTMLWQGVSHTDWELSGWWDDRKYPAATPYTSWGSGNAPKYLIEDAWTPENPNARWPRLSTLSNGNNAWQSSWWIINGTYLRLKNLNIGYTVPENILQKTPFSRINIYLAGTNMITFSHFPYLDPESPSVSSGYYPQQKTYSIGANITF